jgi:long-chain acyl-CoA synthetase
VGIGEDSFTMRAERSVASSSIAYPATALLPHADDIFVSGHRVVQRAALFENAGRAAAGFRALDAGPDHPIALALHNDLSFLEAALGATAAAAPVVILGDPQRLLRSHARVLAIHADLVAPLAPDIPDSTEILVVPTSPEVAAAYNVRSADRLCPAGLERWQDWLNLHDPHPIAASPIPGYRALTVGPPRSGSWLHYALWAARNCELCIQLPRFHAEELLHLVAHYRITHLHLEAPMMLELLDSLESNCARFDVSSLKSLGALPP